MNTDRSFKKNEQAIFLKSLVPNETMSKERFHFIKKEMFDVNTALLQEDKGLLEKIKNFLDITLFEF